MSESGDYSPAPWSAQHDFANARQAYDQHAGRSYDTAVAAGKTATDLLPESLTTNSDAPLSVDCDETGSMGEWPATIFSKLPYLYHEAKTEYLGKGVEISFGAFGDANCQEKFPAQARPFGKEAELETRLKELVIEGGGGGNGGESAELLALYRANCVFMPKAVNTPVHIIITDEKPFQQVSKADAARVHVKLQKPMISTEEIFEALKIKYSVYLILKPYEPNASDDNAMNREVRACWRKYIDDDHVAYLPDPQRVMDVILGILARETGRLDYFRGEIEGRQTPAQVATTYKALTTVHALGAGTKGQKKLPARGAGAPSTMFGGGRGKKSGDLL